MASETQQKAAKPDPHQAKVDDQQLKAAERYSPRASARCWTPQEARAFAAWDE